MAMNEDNRGGLPGGAERDPGLDRLYRSTGREEPPARLDAAILAAAHREAGARPRAVTSLLRRWQVPVSIAAVIVQSVSLVTLVKEEGGGQLVPPTPPSRPSAPPASELARTAPAPAPAEAERPRPSASAPADPIVEPRRDAPTGAPAATDGLARDALGEATGPSSAQQGAGAAASGVAGRPQPQPFPDAAIPPAPGRLDAVPPAASGEDRAERAPAAAERNAAPVAAAPAPEPARSRIMAKARKEAASADAGTPVWQEFEKESPQKWLERIGELRRQGRATDADAMLAEYKRRFPGHPLPPGHADSSAPEAGP
jgi:hypothetical protein